MLTVSRHPSVSLDNDGVTVWHWQRSQIPADIHSSSPDPSSWGTPQARFVSDKCNPSDFFTNMNALFSVRICQLSATRPFALD
jgi:hypothetical protein